MSRNFPSPTDYHKAVMNIASHFDPPIIRSGKIVFLATNDPMLESGGCSLVYKLIDKDGKAWAMKLFREEDSDRHLRYKKLTEYLKTNPNKYFVGIQYFENGVVLNGEEFPVLLIEWIEGEGLNALVARLVAKYAKDNKGDELSVLAGKISSIAKDLANSKIAHGDIHYENIIMRPNGDLVLLDYDDVYIQGVIELHSTVIGKKHFQHPKRAQEGFFGLGVDNFSFWITVVSIYLLIADPGCWSFHEGDETILFKQSDFKNQEKSEIFEKLKNNKNQDVHIWLAIILNDLLNVKSVRSIPPLQNPNQLFQLYRSDHWEPKSDVYDPRARQSLKKNSSQVV